MNGVQRSLERPAPIKLGKVPKAVKELYELAADGTPPPTPPVPVPPDDRCPRRPTTVHDLRR